jgi:hypothetical protein
VAIASRPSMEWNGRIKIIDLGVASRRNLRKSEVFDFSEEIDAMIPASMRLR